MKKFLATLLAVGMVFSMMPTTIMAAEFSDMPSDYSEAALNNAVQNGLLNGDDGKIMPDADLTRAQMAAIVVRALGADGTADLSGFDDVDLAAWYAGELGEAVKMELFQGDGDMMRPNDAITRQEAFVVLSRAFKMEAANTAVLDNYADSADIADWAKTALAAMVEAGFVQGDDGGKINPTANITRKDFAVVIDRMVAQYITTAGTYSEVTEGSVLINTPGVTLKDLTVTENLIIGDGVGDGEVTLDNVTVEGEMIVRGGGVNSIYIKGDSDVDTLKIVKLDGEIRLVTEDGAVVGTVYVDDGRDFVIIEGSLKNLVISEEVPVILRGATIETLSIEAANVDLTVSGGTTVTTLNVTKSATGAIIKVDEISEIKTLNAAGAGTSVSGAGEVDTVEVSGNNVEVDTEGTTVNVGTGVTGTQAGGEDVAAGQTVETPKTPSSSGNEDRYTPVSYKYNVSLPTVAGGTVTANVTKTNTANTVVKIDDDPDYGYATTILTVTTPDGDVINLLENAPYQFIMEVEGTYTVVAEFIKPLTYVELLVVDSQEDYDRLAAHANNEAAYPTDAEYTNLGTDPWLALMLTRNEEYAGDADKVSIDNILFYRNGSFMTKPEAWDGAAISSAISAYIGDAPTEDPTGHAFSQTTLSGTYEVELVYKRASYTMNVMYVHPDEANDIATVSFDLNGALGTAPSDQIIIKGEKVTPLLNDPSRTGYYFAGWYKEAGCINEWNFDTDTVAAPTTLYAKWASGTVTTEAELKAALEANASEITVGADITLNGDVTLGTTLTIPGGRTLTLASGTFTNYGTVIGEVGSNLVAERGVTLDGVVTGNGGGTYNLYGTTTVYSFDTFIDSSLCFNMIGDKAKLLLSEYAPQNGGLPFEHLGSNGLIKLEADAVISLYHNEYTLESGTATFTNSPLAKSTLENNFTVASGATLVIEDGATLDNKATLTIENGGTLENYGLLVNHLGRIVNNGTIRDYLAIVGSVPSGSGEVIIVVDTAEKLHNTLKNWPEYNIEVVGSITLDSATAYRIEKEITITGVNGGGITHSGTLDGGEALYMFAVRGEGNLTLKDLNLTVSGGDKQSTAISVEKAGQLTIDNCNINVSSSSSVNGVFVQGYDPADRAAGASRDTHAGAIKITSTEFNISGTRPTGIGTQILNATDFAEIFADDSLSGNTYNNAFVFRQYDFVPEMDIDLELWKALSADLFDAQFALLKNGEKMARYTLHSFVLDSGVYSDWINTYDFFTKTASGYDVEMSYVEAGDLIAAMENVNEQTAYTGATSVSITLPDEGVTIPTGITITIPENTTVSGTLMGTSISSELAIEEGGVYGGLADNITYAWHNDRWVDSSTLNG